MRKLKMPKILSVIVIVCVAFFIIKEIKTRYLIQFNVA